ncbi:MAG: hypothetical protein H3Z54_06285 [archaeon]|nr:hypothetical protein [archaeon]
MLSPQDEFEARMAELTKLGLTKLQARLYITLLELGISPVRKVVKATSLHKVEVYRVLKELKDIGMAEEVIANPKSFRAIEPKIAIEAILQKEKEKVSMMDQKGKELSVWLESIQRREGEKEDVSIQFKLIEGARRLLERTKIMLENAQREVLFIMRGPMIRKGLQEGVDKIVSKRLSRGMRFRGVINIDKDNIDFAERFIDRIELRHNGNVESLILIVDDREVLFGAGIERQPMDYRKTTALWTRDKGYIRAIKESFESFWKDSIDAKARIAELKTGKPMEQTYVIRDAEEAFKKINETLFLAKREVLVITAPDFFLRVKRYPFKYLSEKGVKIRAILPIMRDNVEVAKEISGYIQLKHIENNVLRMGVIDDQALVFAETPSNLKNSKAYWDGLDNTVYSNVARYVSGIRNLFEMIWDQALDAEVRIKEIETGESAKLTEIVRGKDAIYECILDGLSRTKLKLFVMVDANTLRLIIHDFSLINTELKKRGVRIRFLTQIDKENFMMVKELSEQFEVRHIDQLPIRAILTDEESGFTWAPVEEMPDVGIYSNSIEMTNGLWSIAEDAWKDGIDARARIEEIETGKPIGTLSKPFIEYLQDRGKAKEIE